MKSTNITWHDTGITKQDRERQNEHPNKNKKSPTRREKFHRIFSINQNEEDDRLRVPHREGFNLPS